MSAFANTVTFDMSGESAPEPQRKKPRPYRLRPGTKALREVRKLQKTTHMVIPRIPFERIVREVLQDFSSNKRLSSGSIQALQEAAETYLTEMLREGNNYAIHAKRTTVSIADLQCAVAVHASKA